MDKINPIKIRNKESGEVYELEFNRASVAFAESRGFDIDDVSKFPMTKVEELFYYAFRMHHKNISREKANRILWEDLGGLPEGAVKRLVELYLAPYESMVATTEGDEKNAKAEMEF